MVACLTHVRGQIGLIGDLVGLIVGVSVCRFLLLHCFRIVCGSIIYRWLLDDFLRVGSGMRSGRCRERLKRYSGCGVEMLGAVRVKSGHRIDFIW